MSPKVLALLLLMFGTLFLAFQYQQKSSNKMAQNFPTPLPKSSSEVAGIQVGVSNPSPISVPVKTPKPIIWQTPLPSPTFKAQTTISNIDSFIYPNSAVNSQSSHNASLESSDSSNMITDWYKNKLTSLGFNTNSFVQTNTNGNVLNKLSSAKNNEQVSIEIKKNASASETTINIEVK